MSLPLVSLESSDQVRMGSSHTARAEVGSVSDVPAEDVDQCFWSRVAPDDEQALSRATEPAGRGDVERGRGEVELVQHLDPTPEAGRPR